MSLYAVVLAASAVLVPGASAVHSVNIQHRGESYRVDYRPQMDTRMRTIGAATGARPSTQRCVVTASVAVERVIAGGQSGHELKTMLPGGEKFTRQLPGDCRGRTGQSAGLLEGKASEIAAMLGRTAAEDRHAVLAAIDSANQFAAN